LTMDGPPAESLVWTTVLKLSDEVLYRAYVDSCFGQRTGKVGTQRVLKARTHGRIRLDIPCYAVAYGALLANQNAPEALQETVTIRTAAATPGGRTEAAKLPDAVDGKGPNISSATQLFILTTTPVVSQCLIVRSYKKKGRHLDRKAKPIFER